MAPDILLKVTLSVDDCHCMLPVLPDKVSAVGVVFQQMVWLLEAVPPTAAGFTVYA